MTARCQPAPEHDPTTRRLLYGRRKGKRLRPGRQSLVASLLPQLSIDLAGTAGIDPAALFPARKQAHWLEIGFGAGEHLTGLAAAHPQIGFLGCEPFLNGVAACLAQIEERRLDNVRLLADDARLLLARLPDGCLARAYVLFPDPWPKLRHHRRRFVAAEGLDMLARVLADGAELRLATDHVEYGRWMLDHALRHPAFDWLAERATDWRRRPADEPATRYEEKALAAGLAPLYLRFRRRLRR